MEFKKTLLGTCHVRGSALNHDVAVISHEQPFPSSKTQSNVEDMLNNNYEWWAWAMAAHAFNPSNLWQKQADLCEF